MTDPVSIDQLTDATLDVGVIADVSMVDFIADTTTNRKGVIIDTLEGRLKKLGYEVPVAYTGGIVFAVEDRVKTVDEAGVIYAPFPTALPFTTDGTFANDAAKFFTVQGVKSTDLSELGLLRYATIAEAQADELSELGDVVEVIGDGGAYYLVVSVAPPALGYLSHAKNGCKQQLFEIHTQERLCIDFPARLKCIVITCRCCNRLKSCLSRIKDIEFIAFLCRYTSCKWNYKRNSSKLLTSKRCWRPRLYQPSCTCSAGHKPQR